MRYYVVLLWREEQRRKQVSFWNSWLSRDGSSQVVVLTRTSSPTAHEIFPLIVLSSSSSVKVKVKVKVKVCDVPALV